MSRWIIEIVSLREYLGVSSILLQKLMQVTKILPQDKSSKYPEIKKWLCGYKLWSYEEYIGIVELEQLMMLFENILKIK